MPIRTPYYRRCGISSFPHLPLQLLVFHDHVPQSPVAYLPSYRHWNVGTDIHAPRLYLGHVLSRSFDTSKANNLFLDGLHLLRHLRRRVVRCSDVLCWRYHLSSIWNFDARKPNSPLATNQCPSKRACTEDDRNAWGGCSCGGCCEGVSYRAENAGKDGRCWRHW